MIASHNTFSYMRSSWIMERFARFWRCQTVYAEQQVSIHGVQVCDIRVKKKNGSWTLCHGLACFGPKRDTLEGIISFCMGAGFEGYRLIYEDSSISLDEFRSEFESLTIGCAAKAHCVIYNPTWTVIWGTCELFIEHNKHVWYDGKPFLSNLWNLLFPSIREYALLNNRRPGESDSGHIHMYDYIQYIYDAHEA